MSELSASLGGAAPKHVITCNGQSYKVSLVTQAVKVGYERALFQRARETLAEIKGVVDKDYYERKMDALVDKYQQGEFAMESEFGRKTLGKPGGSLLLLGILMGEKRADGTIEPLPELDVMNLVVQKPEEVTAVFKAVIIESFPGVNMSELADLSTSGEPLPKVPTTQGPSQSG